MDTTSTLKWSRRDIIKTAGAAALATATPSWARADDAPKIKSKITVAQIKIYPVKGDLQANHRRLMEILADIEKEHTVDAVITPEGWLDGYVSTEKNLTRQDMPRYAINPKDSEYSAAVSAWAERNRAWFFFGCSRKTSEGVFNTTLIYRRDGRLIGMYDKLHLQNHDLKYTPGKHLNVYESDFGLFGVMICADRRWPETCRTMTLKGARVIFNPTYGMHGDLNLAMMRTRAFENGIFIIFTHPGQSLITDPRGRVVTNNTNDDDTYTITEIDLSKAPANTGGHIPDRRTDVYEL